MLLDLLWRGNRGDKYKKTKTERERFLGDKGREDCVKGKEVFDEGYVVDYIETKSQASHLIFFVVFI